MKKTVTNYNVMELYLSVRLNVLIIAMFSSDLRRSNSKTRTCLLNPINNKYINVMHYQNIQMRYNKIWSIKYNTLRRCVE